MKKWQKVWGISFLMTLVLGVTLLTAGYVTGGLDDIKEMNAPKQESKTFQTIKSLDLDLMYRDLRIEESKDDKVHLSYYNGKYFIGQLKVTDNQGQLRLEQKEGKQKIGGFLSLASFFLNVNDRYTDQTRIVLAVPKGAVIERLSGELLNGDLEVSNQKIKALDYSGSGEFVQTEIAGGRLVSSNALASFKSSQVSNLVWDLGETYGMVAGSTLTDVKIPSSMNALQMTDSTLERVTISAEEAEVEGNNLTLKGQVTVSGEETNVTMTLNPASHKASSFDLSAPSGQLLVGQALTQGTKIKDSDGEVATFNKVVADEQASLKIAVSDGHVTVD
ncbi:DUF4097 family beta strand repeat-containing protein [Streptococcus cuniculipharyngis]|uniref:DUF4097 domain-containing protein n=1 Tax=Streptococcus cuniculipharyngis TaxID=1562651 RepID=A0A5C5SDA6_9STRE|nr:DUF4097 family beta strand repeat-containing protein [Streptococcus cuniculipharyngis]TWS97666.1 DUF4097 domain-containing protein [Streptococcus cuniculipharyngis]